MDYTPFFQKIIFLLQVNCLATSFLFSVVLMQMIIHTKNQKNIF